MALRLSIKSREKRLVALTVATLLGGLLYVRVLEPLTQEWLALRREARLATAELAELQALLDRKEEIQSAHRRIRDTVATGDTEEVVQLEVLNEVSRLAAACGFEVDSLKPLRKPREGGFERYGVDMSGRCTASAFVALLQSLQAPEHLLKTEKVTVVVGRSTPPLTVMIRVSKLARVERTNDSAS